MVDKMGSTRHFVEHSVILYKGFKSFYSVLLIQIHHFYVCLPQPGTLKSNQLGKNVFHKYKDNDDAK